MGRIPLILLFVLPLSLAALAQQTDYSKPILKSDRCRGQVRGVRWKFKSPWVSGAGRQIELQIRAQASLAEVETPT